MATRRQTRRQKEDAEFWGTMAGVVALIMLAIGILAKSPSWFKSVDCNTANHHLQFIERCEADEDCTLTAREYQQKQSYTRMKLRSCPTTEEETP